MTKKIEYKVEISNKIINSRCVGNLCGVASYIDGCRSGYAMCPQDSEEDAIRFKNELIIDKYRIGD